MPCVVKLYDSSLTPLPSAIEIGVQDYRTRTALGTIQISSGLGGGDYGAVLGFSPRPCSYVVFTNDPGGTYGPATIFPLNGLQSGQLEVVLYPYPSGGVIVGQSPQTFAQITPFIQMQRWRDVEKRAVLMLVLALVIAHEGWAPVFQHVVAGWRQWMDRFGINPGLI